MNLVTRKLLCQRLKISRVHCWRIIGKVRGNVPEQRVLDILNTHTHYMDELTMIPSDLLTVQEAACTLTVDGSPIDSARLLRWINDPFRCVPHIKFSSHLVRLPACAFAQWVKENFKGEAA